LSITKQPPIDVLMLIKTSGLEYDDRLRKEVDSISSSYSVLISCIERGRNIKSEKNYHENLRVKTHKIWTREIFSDGYGIVFKAIESTLRLGSDLLKLKPKTVWIHNFDMILLVYLAVFLKRLGLVEIIIWDFHEIPTISRHGVFREILKNALLKIDAFISTNVYRKDYILRELSISLPLIEIVENYPDSKLLTFKGTLPSDFLSWLENEPYLLAQGGGRGDRYHNEVIKACELVGIKLAIIGAVRGQRSASSNVFYTGQIPQELIIPYVKYCVASVIFYQDNLPNSLYCSPNRLFLAIALGKPVLVGNNPTMKDIVEKFEVGIVLDNDGRDVSSIVQGMQEVISGAHAFEQNSCKASEYFLWEKQKAVLAKLTKLAG
jgi:glycosyltransferase involved in cell wall biosynthesis